LWIGQWRSRGVRLVLVLSLPFALNDRLTRLSSIDVAITANPVGRVSAAFLRRSGRDDKFLLAPLLFVAASDEPLVVAGAEDATAVSLAGRILDQKHSAGSDLPAFSVTRHELCFTGELDHELLSKVRRANRRKSQGPRSKTSARCWRVMLRCKPGALPWRTQQWA
jgi:hypothetical protein